MRYFLGILVILFGITIFLQSSGIIADQNMKDAIGSGLVMAIGIALFVWKRQTWAWASIIFLVGLTDLVENQQWTQFEQHTPWEYVWPVFIIIIGLHLILSRQRKVITKDGSGSDVN